jgi:hypothetical protein
VAGLASRLRQTVAIEAALGVAVLLAALLTAAEPARETYARRPRPIAFSGLAGDVGVNLRVTPGRPGANGFDVRLDGGDGQPPPEIQRVTVRFSFLDQELGSGNLVLQPRDDGSYGAIASNLSAEGSWQIEALVRQRGRDDVRVGFRTAVASPETAGQPPSLDALPPSWASPMQPVAIGLMLLGILLALLRHSVTQSILGSLGNECVDHPGSTLIILVTGWVIQAKVEAEPSAFERWQRGPSLDYGDQ